MQCRKCNTEYSFHGRLEFRARCPQCDTALHVWLQCAYFDRGAYNGCREPKAERIVDKERENRCEYFSPGAQVDRNSNAASGAKKAFGRSLRLRRDDAAGGAVCYPAGCESCNAP